MWCGLEIVRTTLWCGLEIVRTTSWGGLDIVRTTAWFPKVVMQLNCWKASRTSFHSNNLLCQSNNEGCWGPLCFCSCKPTPYPRPPWRCFGSLDIHLCRAREEELMGVPQRQIWAKVDKEQERTRRWRRGFLNFCWRDGKAEVPHTSPRRWLGQCTALGLHLWLQE